MRLLQSLRQRLHSDIGGASLYAVIAISGLMMLAGMVYDGSAQTRATHQANLGALESARAASQGLSGDAIAGTAATVDGERGASAAREYMSANGLDGEISVNGDEVTVTVTQSWTPKFTPFIDGGAVTGTATATPERVEP